MGGKCGKHLVVQPQNALFSNESGLAASTPDAT